ncbi:MAG: type II toxin-antitoxin system VapC family toxin [Cyanobacteria bacterium P01_G01_bin.54]
MKELDTNVLVRFFVRDDESQWEIADRYISQAFQTNETCLINNVVLCELLWVLRSRYKLKREQLIETVEVLVKNTLFVFENREAVLWAVQQMKNGRADFSDYLIAYINQQAGCQETASFDAKLSQLPQIEIL